MRKLDRTRREPSIILERFFDGKKKKFKKNEVVVCNYNENAFLVLFV